MSLRRAALLVLLAVCASSAAAAGARPFDLQGHRGARGLAPENTLAAFARALAIGVTTLELDTALTRDGRVVVSHDPALNPDLTRDAAGNWLEGPGPAIFSMTLAEVQRYDVGRMRPGTPYAERFATAQAVDGERIPTLAQVFALARTAGNAGVRFNVETKLDPRRPELTPDAPAFAEAVVAVVRKEGMAARTTLQSFDWRTLRHARKVAPEIQTACLTIQNPGEDNVQKGQPGASPFLAGLDVDDFGGSVPRLAQAAGCAVWSPNAWNVTPEAVKEAQELGLQVVPWTVNEEAEMERLIDAGVDGLISDYPDRLRQVVARRGRPVPPPTPVKDGARPGR